MSKRIDVNSEYTKDAVDALDLGSLPHRRYPDAVEFELTPERAAGEIFMADELLRILAAKIEILEDHDDEASQITLARHRETVTLVEKQRSDLERIRAGH